MPRRKIKLYKDKRGRYIRRKRKKIYFKGSLDSIKRYIKKLFEKRQIVPISRLGAIEPRYVPEVKGEEIAVQDTNLLNELLQKTKADMVNIAKELQIKNISILPKAVLAERIINAGWKPSGWAEAIRQPRGRKPVKPELLQKIEELTGKRPSDKKSVAELQAMLDKTLEKMERIPEFSLVSKPIARRPIEEKVKEEKYAPSPPPEDVAVEEPKQGLIGSVKSAFGYPPQSDTLFKLKKKYVIPFLESTRYLTLLTGSKNPSEDEIFTARAKYLNIAPNGFVTYNLPDTLTKTQISALVKILDIQVPESRKKDELIDLVKAKLDSGMLDPDNAKIIAEAEGREQDKQATVNLEDLESDQPIDRSSPPVPGEAEQKGDGKNEDDGISNFKIDNIMNKFPQYLGTIGKDQVLTQILPKVKEKSKGGFIINTDPINKKGEHWQAVYFDACNGGDYEINFFDSYADPADERLLSDLKQIAEKLNAKLLLKYKDNRIALQNERSSNCGWFCIKFLTDRFRGKPFIDASGFSNVMKGEKEIRKFKEQHGGFIQYLPSFGKLIPDKVKQFVREKLFFAPDRLPPSAQKVFEQYKDAEITGISVQREPVNSMITKFLNFISLGKFGEIQKKLGYDRFYHLSMNVATTKGRIKIEKNARINIVPVKGIAPDNYGVPNIPKGLTVGEMLEKARRAMNDTEFFQYDALTRNCQKFILGILRANIPSLSKDLVDFIYQPVEELVKNLPGYVQKIARAATDLGAKAQQVMEGGKKKKKA